MAAWGTNFGTWDDSIKMCPREVTLKVVQGVVNYLPDDELCAQIWAALAPIQGANKSHYMQPEMIVFQDNMQALLQSKLETVPTFGTAILIERVAFLAIWKSHKDWLESIIDFDNVMQCNPKFPWSVLPLFQQNLDIPLLSWHCTLSCVP